MAAHVGNQHRWRNAISSSFSSRQGGTSARSSHCTCLHILWNCVDPREVFPSLLFLEGLLGGHSFSVFSGTLRHLTCLCWKWNSQIACLWPYWHVMSQSWFPISEPSILYWNVKSPMAQESQRTMSCRLSFAIMVFWNGSWYPSYRSYLFLSPWVSLQVIGPHSKFCCPRHFPLWAFPALSNYLPGQLPALPITDCLQCLLPALENWWMPRHAERCESKWRCEREALHGGFTLNQVLRQ